MAKKYKERADGRYQAKVWLGEYKENGQKKYQNVYSSKSSGDLERQIEQLKKDFKEGTYTVSVDTSFITYAENWLNVYKVSKSKNTQAMYSNIIKKHFRPLEGIRLKDIKRLHFQILINNSLDHPRTCQQISITFKQVIKAAIRDKYLPESAFRDICGDIELPRYRPDEKRVLTAAEKKAIQCADFTAMEKTFILIAYGCGLRRGEILALTRFKINLKDKELTVNESIAFDNNDPYPKATKSVNGVRTIPMPPFLCDHLEEYLPTLKSSYLITKKDGSRMSKSSYDKMWASIVRKINIAAGGTDDLKVIYGLTAHIFRHNFCANLCYQIGNGNITTKTIARLLGDTEKMVLDVYSHVLDDKEDAKVAVNAAIKFDDPLTTDVLKNA